MADQDGDAPELIEVPPQAETSRVPVTILSGFLGAGKTTLLKHILTEQHGLRIAVIENEYGAGNRPVVFVCLIHVASGIESAIMSTATKFASEDIYELGNGCLCCSARGQLVATIEQLMKKRDKFDYILVETSGMADPGPVAGEFWVDEELESPLRLDGIVVVVDVKHILRHLREKKKDETAVNEAQRQIAYADKILLNKVDLATEEEIQSVEAAIREYNPLVEIVRTTFSRIDLARILHIDAFDPARLDVPTLPADDHSGHTHAPDGSCGCGPAATSQHHHDDSVHAVSVSIDGVFDQTKLNAWLADLLWAGTEPAPEHTAPHRDVFRCKGLVTVAGAARRMVVQGVHTLFELNECALLPAADGADTNRFVFIGRGLDEDSLRAGLQSCRVTG